MTYCSGLYLRPVILVLSFTEESVLAFVNSEPGEIPAVLFVSAVEQDTDERCVWESPTLSILHLLLLRTSALI